MLIAKGNQATLQEDLRLFFSEPPADCHDWPIARTVNKGHGRLEIRELVATTELNELLAGQWAGVAQVFRLRRTVIEQGQTRTEVVYGLTSLSPARACAMRLLEVVREHWAIEDSFKVTKECLGWEEVQVLDLRGIRTLVAMAWVAAGFLYQLGVTLEWAEVQLLAK